MTKGRDVEKMKTTKRKEFIKFLIDSGLDVDTTRNRIDCYYKDKGLFFVSDCEQFQSEITGGLKNLEGELPYKVYSELRKYASLYIEDRFAEYDIEKVE